MQNSRGDKGRGERGGVCEAELWILLGKIQDKSRAGGLPVWQKEKNMECLYQAKEGWGKSRGRR